MSTVDLGFPLGHSGVGTADPNNPQIGPQLNEILKRYGLGSLTGWASRAVINGWSPEQIVLELYQRPEFKTRFSGMFQRETNGMTPISVDEYLDYERTVHSIAATFGMPLDKAEVDSMIGADVSAVEAEKRIGIAATVVYDTDNETRAELQRLWGITPGQQMKYWMDPKKELPKLQQEFRMAEIAGSALRSGYGQIQANQAQRLSDVGMTRDQATQGFAQLAGMDELFNPMDMGEIAITQDTQIEFLAGNQQATEQVEARVDKRQAEFEGGGSFASGREGFATGTAQ